MLLERAPESRRRREEAFLEELQQELRGLDLRRCGRRSPAQVAVLPQQPMDLPLLLRVIHLDGNDPALGDAGRSIPAFAEVGAKPADHRDAVQLLEVDLGSAGIALVVQQFEQGCERLRVSVVRRRREEQPMLEMRRDRFDRRGLLGLARSSAGGCQVVGLVADQQIEPPRIGGLPIRRKEVLEEAEVAVAPQVGVRRDQPGEVLPRIHMHPARAAQMPDQGAVHDVELQPELVPHLFLPLDLQRGGTDDQDRADPVAEDQLLNDQARLDRLTETDSVGDEEVDARHLDGAHQRVELVVLDFDAAAERRVEAPPVGLADDAPPNRVEEGIQPGGIVEGDGLRQLLALHATGANLRLPHDLQLLAEGAVLHGGEADEMVRPSAAHLAAADIRGDEAPPADLRKLADFRNERSGDVRHPSGPRSGATEHGWRSGGRDGKGRTGGLRLARRSCRASPASRSAPGRWRPPRTREPHQRTERGWSEAASPRAGAWHPPRLARTVGNRVPGRRRVSAARLTFRPGAGVGGRASAASPGCCGSPPFDR